MKNKPILLISLILIAFLAGSNYSPMGAKAETPDEYPMVKPLAPGEAIPKIGLSEKASENLMRISIPAITFTPHDSRLSYYNAGYGCLGSVYDGPAPKTFVAPLNLPPGTETKFFRASFYQYNTNEPYTRVYIYRTYNETGDTEVVLDRVMTYSDGSVNTWKELAGYAEFTFEEHYSYWVEIKYPQGTPNVIMCSFGLAYKPVGEPIFPLAFPTVLNGD
jgi:hypothetical protein